MYMYMHVVLKARHLYGSALGCIMIYMVTVLGWFPIGYNMEFSDVHVKLCDLIGSSHSLTVFVET